MSELGHNHLTEATQEKMRQIVSAIHHLLEEKQEIAAEIRDKYAEAKAFGFDTKVLRRAVKEMGRDAAQREEEEMLLDIYLTVLGVA